LKNFTVPLFMV